MRANIASVETDESSVSLSMGLCPGCKRDVLTWLDYDDDGAERRLCVHCDATVETGLRLVDESELSEKDYAFVQEQGCGRPDCGGGRCRG